MTMPAMLGSSMSTSRDWFIFLRPRDLSVSFWSWGLPIPLLTWVILTFFIFQKYYPLNTVSKSTPLSWATV